MTTINPIEFDDEAHSKIIRSGRVAIDLLRMQFTMNGMATWCILNGKPLCSTALAVSRYKKTLK